MRANEKTLGRNARNGQFIEHRPGTTVTEKGSVSIKAGEALASRPVQGDLKAVKQIRLSATKR